MDQKKLMRWMDQEISKVSVEEHALFTHSRGKSEDWAFAAGKLAALQTVMAYIRGNQET